MLYSFLRALLFLLPAEASHDLALRGLRLLHRLGLSSLLAPKLPPAPIMVCGLEFANPVGLAAGLDKNGDYIDALAALGFGFLEIGTVTPRPQPGNPKPRLFRLRRERAIINRMGFNNKGVDYLVERVHQSRYAGVLGINIGKNFDTPVERALDDYLICLRKVYPYASYITINISSPNTPGLRSLQFGAALDALLAGIKAEQHSLAAAHGVYKPLAVKIAPDLSDEEIATAATAFLRHGIDMVIATNTSTGRSGVEASPLAGQAGGLSGQPIAARTTEVLSKLAAALAGKIPLIGVGGIQDSSAALAKFEAGAVLVQIYTGFIYRGPNLIGEILADRG